MPYLTMRNFSLSIASTNEPNVFREVSRSPIIRPVPARMHSAYMKRQQRNTKRVRCHWRQIEGRRHALDMMRVRQENRDLWR